MEYMIIGLLSVAILLYIVTFFRKDKVNQIEEQVDQLSLTLMHETYQLKKKMKILEEELLINEQDIPKPIPSVQFENESIISKVESGLPLEQIAKELALPIEEVRLLIEQARRQRGSYDK